MGANQPVLAPGGARRATGLGGGGGLAVVPASPLAPIAASPLAPIAGSRDSQGSQDGDATPKTPGGPAPGGPTPKPS